MRLYTHTHTHTHTDVQLENRNAQETVEQKANANNFESKNYYIINKIEKEVNSLCIQIHKLSLLSFLRLLKVLKNYVLQFALSLTFCRKFYMLNKSYSEGGNM